MNLVVCNYFVFCRDVVLCEDAGAESQSASQSGLGKPPSTPEMSAHDAEVMANAMLLDSPPLDPERANEENPEDGGSSRLPGEGEGEKLPKGADDKQPVETPAGKLVVPCRKIFFYLLLM